MPVSSPSYFPPAGPGGQIVGTTAGQGATGIRNFLAGSGAGKFTTQSDIIVVGDTALAAGTQVAPVTDVNLGGLIVIGSQAAAALTAVPNFGASFGPSTIIGFKAFNVGTGSNLNTIVGSNAMAVMLSTTINQAMAASVVIGESTGTQLSTPPSGVGGGYLRTVTIGTQAGSGLTQAGTQQKGFFDNVIIGYQAVSQVRGAGVQGGPQVSNNVCIGSLAGQKLGNLDTATGSTDNVFIGFASGDPGDARANVYIGSSASGNTPGGTNNVAIGSFFNSQAVVAGVDRNVVIGSGATNPSNSRCIILGAEAGAHALIATANDQVLFETWDFTAAKRRTFLYGVNGDGATAGTGIIFGFSSPGINRDLPGTQVVKIMAGAASGVAPVGGGFFYVSNAPDNALHYVDSNNIDAALSASGAQFLGANLGRISPAALAAGVTDNYAPAGFAAAQVLRLSANAAGSTLGGLAGGTTGRYVCIINVSANNLTLAHQAGTSLAANRFSLPGAANVVLGANGSIELWFDTDTGNWRSFNR